MKKRYKYLSGRIHKEYDTKRPLTTKENIEYSLQQQKDMLTIPDLIKVLNILIQTNSTEQISL